MASLMDILRQAGFSGQALNMAYAIAMAESGGNARAFNGNTSTGDRSYGLFQINMLGGMGPERRKQFGLSSNDDLYDAVRNAQVAYKMSKGGTDWSPWSTYQTGLYKKYIGGGGTQVSAPTAKLGGTSLEVPKSQQNFLESSVAPGLAAPDEDPFAPQQQSFKPKAPEAPAQTPGMAKPQNASSSSSFRDKVISYAMQMLGTPYVWGGTGANGVDCSGLVKLAFGKAGFDMPRVSWDQLKQGQRTSLSNLRPGDLVGFRDGGHVALYLGGGKILEAPRTGLNVRVRTLGSNEDAWGVRLTLPGD